MRAEHTPRLLARATQGLYIHACTRKLAISKFTPQSNSSQKSKMYAVRSAITTVSQRMWVELAMCFGLNKALIGFLLVGHSGNYLGTSFTLPTPSKHKKQLKRNHWPSVLGVTWFNLMLISSRYNSKRLFKRLCELLKQVSQRIQIIQHTSCVSIPLKTAAVATRHRCALLTGLATEESL